MNINVAENHKVPLSEVAVGEVFEAGNLFWLVLSSSDLVTKANNRQPVLCLNTNEVVNCDVEIKVRVVEHVLTIGASK